MVKFDISADDSRLISKIVTRAWSEKWLRDSYTDKLSLRMDLVATHVNGNPLRLAELLKADDFNFAHDMSGICNCLDRETGKLTRNFSPRFSRKEIDKDQK